MRITDISIADAEAFLEKFERHYKSPAEPICAIAVGEDTVTVSVNKDAQATHFEWHGAAILGRRGPGCGELAHIYCDGASQAYSLLYGACWRALKALGYEKAVL